MRTVARHKKHTESKKNEGAIRHNGRSKHRHGARTASFVARAPNQTSVPGAPSATHMRSAARKSKCAIDQ